MKQVQFRGGTEQEHLKGNNGTGFTGLEREITVDTTRWSLRVHDGITVGGFLLAGLDDVYTKEVIDEKIATIVSGGTITLDGYATKEELKGKSNIDHAHTEYATADHSHENIFASISHEQSADTITFEDGENLLYKFTNNKLSNINFDDYVPNTVFEAHTHDGFSGINHKHTEYSPIDHNHSSTYSPITHEHTNYIKQDTYNEGLKAKANICHEHSPEDIKFSDGENLLDKLGSANTEHNHDGLYYNKEQIDDKLEGIRGKKFLIYITKDQWAPYTDGLLVYYLTHNFQTVDTQTLVRDDNGIVFADTQIISDNEVAIIGDEAINCTIIISAI